MTERKEQVTTDGDDESGDSKSTVFVRAVGLEWTDADLDALWEGMQVRNQIRIRKARDKALASVTAVRDARSDNLAAIGEYRAEQARAGVEPDHPDYLRAP